ncbi:MAG: DUF721 domain-containing protein [Terriglobia bacterium]
MEEIARILPKILKKGPLARRQPVLELLVALWPRVAGKFIAQHSLPVTFQEGTLALAVESPIWAAQLRQMSEPLRAHINNFLGASLVKKLSVKQQTSLTLSSAPETMLAVESAPSPVPVPWNEEEVRLDPELARTVELSFAKYFSRRHRSLN